MDNLSEVDQTSTLVLCRNRMLTYVSRECNVYGYLTWLNDETVNSNFHRNKTVNDNVPFVNGPGKSLFTSTNITS